MYVHQFKRHAGRDLCLSVRVRGGQSLVHNQVNVDPPVFKVGPVQSDYFVKWKCLPNVDECWRERVLDEKIGASRLSARRATKSQQTTGLRAETSAHFLSRVFYVSRYANVDYDDYCWYGLKYALQSVMWGTGSRCRLKLSCSWRFSCS